MTPQTMDDEKKVRPFGQVNLAGCSLEPKDGQYELKKLFYEKSSTHKSQAPSIFPSVQFITAIWTKVAHIVATT